MSSWPRVGDDIVKRPTECPFCNGKVIDTLARVFTADTAWRCRECDRTWTMTSQKRATNLR